MDNIWLLAILLLAILAVYLLFWMVDKLINSKPKKKPSEKSEKPKEAAPEKKEETPQAINVYIDGTSIKTEKRDKSLADEIEQLMEKEESGGKPKSADIPAPRLRAYDRIRKFRESRHYDNYDNDSLEPAGADGIDGGISTEEYYKILALAAEAKHGDNIFNPPK
jgi:hypothetical protein